MLPNLRIFLGTMVITAILATVVGLVLVPAPGDPYLQSAGLSSLGQQGQPESPDKEQLRLLGYARRADELNRLMALGQLPSAVTVDPVNPEHGVNQTAILPPTSNERTDDEGTAATTARLNSSPAEIEAQRADKKADTATTNDEHTGSTGGEVEQLATSSLSEPARVQGGSGAMDAVATGSVPVVTTLPPEKPKPQRALIRRRLGAVNNQTGNGSAATNAQAAANQAAAQRNKPRVNTSPDIPSGQ